MAAIQRQHLSRAMVILGGVLTLGWGATLAWLTLGWLLARVGDLLGA